MNLAHLKGRFPFRVGAPSYVFPADILPNVKALADAVDDVELALFESDAISPLPGEDTIRELAACARAKALTYTVHLPLDADIGGRDETERRESVRKVLAVAARTAPLRPFGFVMHCPAPADPESAAVRAEWLAALSRSAEQLLAEGLDPRSVCIETLDYPLHWIDDVMRAFGFSVCLDVGHALLHGQSVRALVERYFGRTRVLHLHGVADGKDHRALSAVDPEALSLILSALREKDGADRVLTLEVFSEDRLRDSMATLAERWERREQDK
jgi:sugar phosphate isomerase/epimerase